jgi:hypothetical protein
VGTWYFSLRPSRDFGIRERKLLVSKELPIRVQAPIKIRIDRKKWGAPIYARTLPELIWINANRRQVQQTNP